MPRFDGTGPAGMGPRTGRGMGLCGSGFGRGYGMGSGYNCPTCPMYGRRMTKDEEKELLKEELEEVKAEAKAVEERLSELE